MELRKIKKRATLNIFLISVLILSVSTVFASSQEDLNSDKITIYFFWGDGCPHCEDEKIFLEELEQEYGDKIEVKMFETWKNKENVELFQEAATAYGIQARGVPTTFIGEKHWIGYSDYMALEMESYIQKCINEGCEDPLEDLNLQGDEDENKSKEDKINQRLNWITFTIIIIMGLFIYWVALNNRRKTKRTKGKKRR